MLDFAIFAVTFVTALLIAVFYLYPGSRKTGTTIPGMDPSDPKDGNLVDIQQAGSFHEFLMTLHNQYGPIASFWLDSRLIVSLASPDTFQQQEHAFDRPGDLVLVFKHLLGQNSIFFMNGVNARHQHRILNEILSQSSKQKYYTIYQKLTDEMINKLKTLPNNQHVPLHQYMMALAIKALLVTLFGDYFNEAKNIIELRKNFEICSLDIEQKIQGSNLDDNPSQKRKVDKAIEAIRSQLNAILDQQADQPPESNSGIFTSLCSRLNESRDSLIDNAVTVIYEGFQTTGTMLTWLLYYVAANKNVEENVVEEIKTVVGEKDLTEELLNNLSYLNQVINETLRMSCLRTFTARCHDIDVEIGGHLIPKETPVVHALGVVLMDKQLWPEPDKFDPERFSASKISERPPLIFSPWGFAGKRSCPGKSFASTLAKIVLIRLLQVLQLNLVDGQMVLPFYGTVTKPEDEIWVTIKANSS